MMFEYFDFRFHSCYCCYLAHKHCVLSWVYENQMVLVRSHVFCLYPCFLGSFDHYFDRYCKVNYLC